MLAKLKCALLHRKYHARESRTDGMSFMLKGGECAKCKRRWIGGTGYQPGDWAALAVRETTREQRIIFRGEPLPGGFEWWQESYLPRKRQERNPSKT